MSTHYISDVTVDNISYNIKDTWLREQTTTAAEEVQSLLDTSRVVGICADFENSTFTRLAAATNLEAGSDFDQFSMYGNRRRCNVLDDGTITAYYGDGNFKEDGSNGQVMVYQPKFYYRVEPLKLEEQYNAETNPNGIGYHLRKANYFITDYPKYGFKLHPAFYDEDGNEIDYYLTSAYEGSLYDVSESLYINNDAQVADFDNDMLCSIGQDPNSQDIRGVKPISGKRQNLIIANCEKLAQNRGSRWHVSTIQIESAEQLLMAIEFCSFNMQNSIGNGVVTISDDGSNNCSSLTGSTSTLGNSTGCAVATINTKGSIENIYTTNGTTSVSYRGRENPYGNIWKFVEGMIIAGRGESKGGIPFICNSFAFPETSSTTAGTGTHDFTLNGYTSAGFTITNTDGYISAMGYGNELYDWLFVASECSGNSTVPVGDYTYKTANLNGTRVALLGGFWTDGTAAGSFYWHLGVALTYRNRTVGGRAALIPRKLTRSILT